MVNDLVRIHVTHIYSDYWTCNRVIFQSNERIICSSLNETLHPQDNRYPRYQTIVEHDAHASYVFQIGSTQALTLEQQIRQTGKMYTMVELDGYVVYEPKY